MRPSIVARKSEGTRRRFDSHSKVFCESHSLEVALWKLLPAAKAKSSANAAEPMVVIVHDTGTFLIFRIGAGCRMFCKQCFDEIVVSRAGPMEQSQRVPCVSPFLLERLRQVLRHISSDSSLAAFAIDGVTGATVQFEGQIEPLCASCARQWSDQATAALLEPFAAMKPRPDIYRERALDELRPSLLRRINRYSSNIGSRVDALRHSRYIPTVAGGFHVGDARVHWFGSSRSFGGAAASGAIEAIERDAGTRSQTSDDCVWASWNEIRDSAMDPRILGLYDDATYRRERRLKKFDPKCRIQWTSCFSLVNALAVFVPVDFVRYSQAQLIFGNSSGTATGSSPTEAQLFGLLELVERDAFMYHWLNRISPPRIQIESLPDIEVRTLVARLRSQGVEPFLLDIQVELGVPVVMALLLRKTGEYGCLSVATAAHMDPLAAARRALQEAAAQQEGFPERSHRAALGHLKDIPVDFSAVRQVEDHALLYGNPRMRVFAEFLLAGPNLVSLDSAYSAWESDKPSTLCLADDLSMLITRFRAAGMIEVLTHNQTTSLGAQLGLHTARMLVPGLLPIDFGFGLCRGTQLPRAHKFANRYSLDKTLVFENHAPHPFA